MINIKCLNKNQDFFFYKYAGKENCTKFFSLFYKQIKNWDGRFLLKNYGFYEKPSTPIFFICLYFIVAEGDENLKKFGLALCKCAQQR